MWLKVGDQVRQDPAGHSEEFELDSQSGRRLLGGFSAGGSGVSPPDCSFRKSSRVCVENGLEGQKWKPATS